MPDAPDNGCNHDRNRVGELLVQFGLEDAAPACFFGDANERDHDDQSQEKHVPRRAIGGAEDECIDKCHQAEDACDNDCLELLFGAEDISHHELKARSLDEQGVDQDCNEWSWRREEDADRCIEEISGCHDARLAICD